MNIVLMCDSLSVVR